MIHLHRVVDDQIDRHQRLDLRRILAELLGSAKLGRVARLVVELARADEEEYETL